MIYKYLQILYCKIKSALNKDMIILAVDVASKSTMTFKNGSIIETLSINNRDIVRGKRSELPILYKEINISCFWNKEDSEWLQKVKENPSEYQIIIDNDCIWVETDSNNGIDETKCVYTFSLYGYEFIYGLLKQLSINVDFC